MISTICYTVITRNDFDIKTYQKLDLLTHAPQKTDFYFEFLSKVPNLSNECLMCGIWREVEAKETKRNQVHFTKLKNSILNRLGENKITQHSKMVE